MKKIFFLLFLIFLNVHFVFSMPKKEEAIQAASDKTEIRMGYLQSDLHQLAAFVAIKKGFFESEGLDVKVAGIFKAGPEEMNAFAAEDLDIGYQKNSKSGLTLKEARESVEKELLLKCIKKFNWNLTKVSNSLGIARSTVYDLMEKYNLSHKSKRLMLEDI